MRPPVPPSSVGPRRSPLASLVAHARSARPLAMAIAAFVVAACEHEPLPPIAQSPPPPALRHDVAVVPGNDFTQVSAGFYHTCAVESSGTVECWGTPPVGFDYGQAVVPAALAGVAQVSAGLYHSCALKNDGTVACWGTDVSQNVSGAVGKSGVVQVSAGSYHTCALDAAGAVACWGDNEWGQVGGAATTVAPYTAQVTHPGPFSRVSAGSAHTCAVRADGTVECWGLNGDGQSSVPAGLVGVTDVSTGIWHTCALRAVGSVTCWGRDRDGQVSGTVNATYPYYSVFTHAGPFTRLGGGGDHTCALRPDGTVACWGANYYGQATPPAGSFVQVSASEYQSCAVRADGTLTCWGSNAYGQLLPPWPFTGFLQPVDNPGPNEDVVNRAKAGVGIPVKFSLGGDRGLAIFKPGYPRFLYTACDAGGTDFPIDATTSSPGGLSYDASTGQYTYVWKTDKAWAGTCGTFELGLTDASNHHALFRFVR